jgi:hypothetical protein
MENEKEASVLSELRKRNSSLLTRRFQARAARVEADSGWNPRQRVSEPQWSTLHLIVVAHYKEVCRYLLEAATIGVQPRQSGPDSFVAATRMGLAHSGVAVRSISRKSSRDPFEPGVLTVAQCLSVSPEELQPRQESRPEGGLLGATRCCTPELFGAPRSLKLSV